MPIGIDFSAEAAPLGRRHAGTRAGGIRSGRQGPRRARGQRAAARQREAATERTHRAGTIRRIRASRAMRGSMRRCCARHCAGWMRRCLGRCRRACWRVLPDSVAQRAELSAHVVAGGGEVALQQLAGMLDDAPVSGASGSSAVSRRPSPSICRMDRLALDPWLPSRLPADLADLSRPASGLDAELRLNIRQATLAGSTIDGLAVDAAIEAGSILLRRFEGTARGAHFAASGMLGDGGRLSDGRLSDRDAGSDAAGRPVARWRGEPTPALWHGPAKLDVQLAGPQEALAADVRTWHWPMRGWRRARRST